MKNRVTTKTIQALQKGDHRAFESVFIAYFPKVKYFLYQLIRSQEDAEELAQELFVKLWENHSSLDASQSFHSYIYTLARNAAFNFIKHQRVVEAYHQIQIPEELATDTEELLFAKEISLLIEMVVSQMPEQRQRIYRMSRQEDISNEEIANLLHISKKTVENQLSLALKELRKVLSLVLFFFT